MSKETTLAEALERFTTAANGIHQAAEKCRELMTPKISHERAKNAALRLIRGSFRRDGQVLESDKRPRFTIPCRPQDDDDCVIIAYIEQQEALNRG